MDPELHGPRLPPEREAVPQLAAQLLLRGRQVGARQPVHPPQVGEDAGVDRVRLLRPARPPADLEGVGEDDVDAAVPEHLGDELPGRARLHRGLRAGRDLGREPRQGPPRRSHFPMEELLPFRGEADHVAQTLMGINPYLRPITSVGGRGDPRGQDLPSVDVDRRPDVHPSAADLDLRLVDRQGPTRPPLDLEEGPRLAVPLRMAPGLAPSPKKPRTIEVSRRDKATGYSTIPKARSPLSFLLRRKTFMGSSSRASRTNGASPIPSLL